LSFLVRFSLALALLLAACTSRPAITSSLPPPGVASTDPVAVAGEITVFAASSLTDAFTEMGDNFRTAFPGTIVAFNFAASTQLVTQLGQGARADVFASADQLQMERAKAAGLIDGAAAIFARNRLLIVTPADNPGGLRGPADLAKPGLKLVTSQPDVPVGLYTQEMLDRMSRDPQFGADFGSRVNANIVSQEANVRQILAKVQLGEADAAIVYRSDVTPRAEAQLRTFDIPDEINSVASYPIAAVQGAPNPVGTAAFIGLVLSPTGQSILAKWNFEPPGTSAG
jgi:molybdate transport system substrate-binding protein